MAAVFLLHALGLRGCCFVMHGDFWGRCDVTKLNFSRGEETVCFNGEQR